MSPQARWTLCNAPPMSLMVLAMALVCCPTITVAQGSPDPVQYFLSNLQVPTIPPVFAEPSEYIVNSSTATLSLTLRVRSARVDLGVMQFTSRVFCTDRDGCSFAGPTLRMVAGARVNVTLVNELGVDSTVEVMNHFHSPNRTNMHTHGLHIDPSIDSVFIKLEPGESHLYQYVLADDHAPGNHWYHSHMHGSSSFQIGGGLVGSIIVDASPADCIPTELTAMHRHLLLLQHAFVDVPPTFTTALSDPFAGYSLLMYSRLTGSTLDMAPTYVDTNVRDIYTTNALYQPLLDMYVDEYRIFDLVNAVGDCTLEVEIRSSVGAAGVTSCEMILISSDGVYLSDLRARTFLVLLPATRHSVVVRCSSAGTYYLQSYANPSRQPVDQEVRVTQNLLTLRVTPVGADIAVARSLPSSASFAAIRRPSYLSDLRNVTLFANSSWSISIDQTAAPRDVSWLGIGEACPLPCFGRGDCDAIEERGDSIDPTVTSAGTCTYEPFMGAKGVSTTSASIAAYRHVSIMGIAEEVSIWGRGVTPHPVHIHVNHMQVLGYIPPGTSASSVSASSYATSIAALFGEIGDWRDTWPALAGTSILRLWPSNFGGEVMIHCHYLKHEDTGMMTSIRIVNPLRDGDAYVAALAARVSSSAKGSSSSSGSASTGSTSGSPSSHASPGTLTGRQDYSAAMITHDEHIGTSWAAVMLLIIHVMLPCLSITIV